MNNNFKTFKFLFAFLLLTGCTGYNDVVSDDVPFNEQLASFDQFITTLDSEQEINASLLFARDGEIIYQRAAGKVHPQKDGRLSVDSSFNLGSVSKQFTAMGIMLLEHQGKLEFDAEVKKYVPNFPYPEITVRHLLHHTSGLDDYMLMAYEHWQEEKTFTNKDMLELFQKLTPDLLFTSGEKYNYSNTGYVFLSTIIEHISQQSFENYMQENIFNPLNMSNSGVVTLLSKPNSLPSRVYGQDDGELKDLIYLNGVTGDASVYSSANDLLRWHKALLNYELLPKEKQSQAFKPATLNDGSLSYYGFGWALNKKKPEIEMTHSGAWGPFRATIARNINNNVAVIFLSSDNSGVDTQELLNRFLTLVRSYHKVLK